MWRHDKSAIMKIQYFMSCFIAGMLSIPTMLNTANFISLDEHEKKLIAQGDIITREIDAEGKRGRTFEAIGLIKASKILFFPALEMNCIFLYTLFS